MASSVPPPPPHVGGDWSHGGDRIPPRHKRTCDFCCQRKRKCDGDGRGSCSFCLARGATCHYSSRRPNRPRASSLVDARGGGNSGSSSDGVPTAGVNLDGKRGWLGKRAMTEDRQPMAFATLKRARLGASPATGLVHTKENLFLGTFFDSLGFLPLVDESRIRQAIMETMLAPRGTRTAKDSQESGAHGLRQTRSEPSGESTAVVVATSTPRVWAGAGAGPGERQSRGTPLTCTLWCAIAIGALVQGQPPQTVVPYARLAWKALSDCFDQNTAEAARAFMMMAYLYNFLRDDINFCHYLRFAVSVVDRLEPEEAAAAQDIEVLLMRGDETRSYHTAEQRPWELQGYQMDEQPDLKVPTFIVKKTLCNFLFKADRRMYAAFLKDQKALLLPPEKDKTSPADQNVDGLAGARAGLGRGDSNSSGGGGKGGGADRGAASVVGTSVVSEKARPSRQQGSSWEVIQEWIPLFTRMEEAADLPEVGGGVGGLVYNGVHAYIEMAVGNTIKGFNKITRSAEILIRYPGLCRFSVWLHLSHCLLAFLSAFKSEETFEKLRDAYNKVRAQGTAAVPTYSEWTTVGFCNHIFCRAIDERLRKSTKQAVEVNAEGEEINSEDKHQHPNQTQPKPSDQHQLLHQHHLEGGTHRATPSPPPLPPQASIPSEAVSAQDVPGQTVTRNYQTFRQEDGLRSPQPLYGAVDDGGGGGKAKAGLPGAANICPSPDNDASCLAGATLTPYSHAVASMAGISTAAGAGVGIGTLVADGGGGGRGGSVVCPSSARDTERGYREGDWRLQTSAQTSAAAFPEHYVVEASPPVSLSGVATDFVVEPSPPVSFAGLTTGGDGRLVSWPKETTPALPSARAATAAAAGTAMVVPVQGFHGGDSYDAAAGDGDGNSIGVGGDVTTAEAAGGWGGGGGRSRDISGRERRSREATGPRDTFAWDWMGSGTGGGW